MKDNQESHLYEAGTSDPDFLARVEQYLEDGLSAAELAHFERELVDSAEKRQAFLLVCLGEAFAREELGASDVLSLAVTEPHGKDAMLDDISGALDETIIHPALRSQFSQEDEPVRAPVWFEQRQSNPRRRWFIPGGIAAALFISITVGAFLLLRSGSPEHVAIVAQVVNVQWEPTSSFRVADQLVKGQTIALADGYVELHFLNDTRVIIEGPGEITLDSGNSIRLAKGKVAVRMATGSKGFAVRTPAAVITDMGTEFGVHFIPASNSTDVHVFKGLVSVEPSNKEAATGSISVMAGDAVKIADSGRVNVIHGGAEPQSYVRDLLSNKCTLELADLISGGDGLGGLRGGVVDQTTGNTGTIRSTDLGGDLRGDDQYHRTSSLPAVDGCFVPGSSGKPIQVDSAGNRFAFPPTVPRGTVKICAGGVLPQVKQGDVIPSVLRGIDYAAPSHSFLFIHPSAGITFDLDAIRRLHPNNRLASFHCVVGNPSSGNGKLPSNVFILVNGQARFSKMSVLPQTAPLDVEFSLSASDHFLTLASTVTGSGVLGHQIIFGDPTLTLMP